MNSRFHFSQKDNKNNLKEDESHYSTKDESVYNANVNNNKQSYHTFSPWEKYSYYYQPKVTIPFYDNRTNIYNFINNDKYDYYVNNSLHHITGRIFFYMPFRISCDDNADSNL